MSIKMKHSQGIPKENIKSHFKQCSISLFILRSLKKRNQCYPKTAVGLHYKLILDRNSKALSNIKYFLKYAS